MTYLYTKSLSGFGLIDAMTSVIFSEEEQWTTSEVRSPTLTVQQREQRLPTDIMLGTEDCQLSTELNTSILNEDLRRFSHPCLSRGEYLPDGEIHDLNDVVHGDGDFDKCYEIIKTSLLPKAPEYFASNCLRVRG